MKYTALNPFLTLPLLLAGKYTLEGGRAAASHATAWKHLKTLVVLGLLEKVSGWLDSAVSNNFKSDAYVWSQEVVVVTGGSDGIGKIVVQLLAEKGVKVAVLDVQELTYEGNFVPSPLPIPSPPNHSLYTNTPVAPSNVHFFPCDLSSPSSITTASSQIRTSLGSPTILINNAGVARGKTILDTTERDLNLTFRVNTFAHYHLAREFLPDMVSRNHGMIVTVASMAGYVCAPSLVDYAASKAAAIAFHEGLAAELVTHYKADKVRTVLMCQGYTRTKLFEGFGGGVLFPETVAEEIVKAVFAGRSKHLILPESAWGIAPKLRGLPVWMQYGLRARLDGLMKGWRGRQVVQPSLEEAGEKKIEESTVLVDGE